MKRRIKFLLTYLAFWLIFFTLLKVLFLIYQQEQSSGLNTELIAGIFWNGLKLDLSASSYVSALPFLLIALSIFIPLPVVNTMMRYYTYFALLLVSMLCMIDLEIFRTWGSRLDATPLMYLSSPREMMASAGASPVLLLIALWLGVAFLAGYVYTKTIHPILKRKDQVSWFALPFFLVLSGALIIPMRGGLQLAPINQSHVYFSANSFANQAAVNVFWNFFDSLSRGMYDKTNPYRYMNQPVAETLVEELYNNSSGTGSLNVLSRKRPNILLILWESLTAKATLLHGRENITPAFNALAKEGILFSNLYASGDRSDKGIIATLSGYPAQPTESIIKMPSKSSRLPSMVSDLRQAGYKTAFYYGGEPEFANIKSYLIYAGFEKLVSKEDFNEEDWNSKWGAHDHVVFERLYQDLQHQKEPFFNMIFTLSSHEPFEIPAKPLLSGNDEETKFLNALHYTDQALGDFIKKIKKAPWYKNTLVIILADHGHRMPDHSARHEAAKFHIPMLWLGGALQVRDTVITTVASQTDLANTLLHQLAMDIRAYSWSKNILNPQITPFAQYVFNDGMGFVTPDGYIAFDNKGRKILHKDADLAENVLEKTQAHLQVSYGDFLDK